ncbi:MAG: DNA polymerase III subunit beta [Clostridia bacterium]|nr:DNA polymerase III subunit beta [Clostridia bacterium]
MIFTCQKDLFQESINICSRAITSKTTMPVLEGFLIETSDIDIKITGYNLEMGIECNTPASVEEPGSVIIPCRILSDIIREMPDGEISFNVSKDNKVTIKNGSTEFKFSAFAADEYPELPIISYDKTFNISSDELKRIIRQTLFAVSSDDSRPVLTGSLFEIEKEDLTVVSLDGYRLAIRKGKIQNENGIDTSFIVPGKALSEISKITEENKEITFYTSNKHLVVETENIKLYTRLLEGQFFNYKSAVPQNNEIEIPIKTDEFINSIRRVSPIISEINKSPIRCNFEFDTLKMSCISPLGSAYNEIKLERNDKQICIGFNNKFLMEALRACECEKVILKVNTPVSPAVIIPEDKNDNSFLYLVLPWRLNND